MTVADRDIPEPTEDEAITFSPMAAFTITRDPADPCVQVLCLHVAARLGYLSSRRQSMADDVVRDIPEEMVEKAAHTHAELDGYDWDQVSSFWQGRYRKFARAVLSAALAGRQVVDAPDDGHCAKCGQPFPENIRDVVLTEQRLPFDARDRIERALRDFNAPGVGQIAHHIMLALTGSGSGED